MNNKNQKILALVSVALILILIAMQFGGDDSVSNGRLLFPELKSRIDTMTSLTVTRAGADNVTEISKDSDHWVNTSRDSYPANVNKLRQILLQIADARIVEQKTSNPDRYSQLGVQDPGIQGSKGVQLTLAGPDMNYELIVGNLAQAGYRYVRIAEELQSWLIDQKLEIPDSDGEWLVREIVDIKSADIRSVSIEHADGEVIGISKESAESTVFEAANIPDNRELRYSTVANSIAGVLNALTLDDVRKAAALSSEAVSTTFETFDGANVIVMTDNIEGESWITLQVTGGADTDSTVAGINDRVRGWQFKIANYKANQLTRRWEDILKAEVE